MTAENGENQVPADTGTPAPAHDRAIALAGEWQAANSKQRNGLVRHVGSLPDEARSELIAGLRAMGDADDPELAGSAEELLAKVETKEEQRQAREVLAASRERIRDDESLVDVMVRRLEVGDYGGAERFFRKQFSEVRPDIQEFVRRLNEEWRRLDLISDTADEGYLETAREVLQEFEQAMTTEGLHPLQFDWSSAAFVLRNWESEHERTRAFVERAMTATIENCRTPREIVTVLRELATTSCDIGNEAIGRAARIINQETPAMPEESAASELLYHGYAGGSPEVLDDLVELQHFLGFAKEREHIEEIRPFGSPVLANLKKRMKRMMASTSEPVELQIKRLVLLARNRPETLEFTSALLDSDPKEIEETHRQFVASLQVHRQSRYTRAFDRHRYRVWGRQGELPVVVPGYGNYFLDQTDHAELREAYCKSGERVDPNADPYVEDEYWESLCQLLPEGLGRRGLRGLRRANDRLRREVIDEGDYFLSSRGDRIIIEDPALREFGFSEVMFSKFESDPTMARVRLKIGNLKFECVLNETMDFLQAETLEPLDLPKESAFLQHVILCHYRELRCFALEKSDRVTTVSGEAIDEPRFRRGHLHRLQKGQRAHLTQIKLAMEEQGFDLARDNEERQRRGLVPRTYYGETELTERPAPMKMRTPHATVGLRRILERAAKLRESNEDA